MVLVVALLPAPFLKYIPQSSAYEQICRSMRLNGFLSTSPIVLYNGAILLGRARYHACLVTKTEPVTREYAGECKRPELYAVSDNVYRLSREQLNSVSRGLMSWIAKKEKARRKISLSARTDETVAEFSRKSNPFHRKRYREVAKACGAGKGSYRLSRRINNLGCPELIAAFNECLVNVNLAMRLCRMDHDSQRMVLSGLISGNRHPLQKLHDEAGTLIPDHLAAPFRSRPLVLAVNKLGRVTNLLDKAASLNPYVTKDIPEQIRQIMESLKALKPRLVCSCGGQGCELCNDLGWLK